MTTQPTRCTWAGTPLSTEYHDREWGLPLHDERGLFEFLVLEGAQAGLSWETILRKRERYRQLYDGFDPAVVAAYGAEKTAELLSDAGIIRNRLKVAASIANAQGFLKLQQEFGSFDAYLWGFVDGKPIVNHWASMREIPVSTPLAERISKDLRKRGFSFVGPTIIYSMMQAVGVVNDHTLDCYRWAEVQK